MIAWRSSSTPSTCARQRPSTSPLAATDLDDVELVRAASVDGRTATVTLRSTWEAPLHTELVPLEVPIEVTVTARSVFH